MPTAGKLAALYCNGDFNGDGLIDVVAADPNGSSIYYFMKSMKGSYLPPKKFASYNGISSLSKFRTKSENKDSLLVCSKKENIVGIAQFKNNTFGFPKNLEISGTLMLAAALDFNSDKNDEILVLKQTGRRYKIEVINNSDDDLNFELPLGSITREPTHILTSDFNNDGHYDIGIIIPRTAMRVFLKNENNQLTEFIDESGLMKSQFDDIDPSQFSIFDYDGDGKKEWVLTKPGYMRFYSILGDKLTIKAQCNARNEGDDICSAIHVKTADEDKIIAYNQDNMSVQIFLKKENGVFRYDKSEKIGRIDVQYTNLNNPANVQSTLIFGRYSFWHIPFDSEVYSHKVLHTASTKIEKARFQKIAFANLDDTPEGELVAIDGNNGFMEVFSFAPEKQKWKSIMSFKIFESQSIGRGSKKPINKSRYDPREFCIADFNNDQKKDTALLYHDKVLVYMQN